MESRCKKCVLILVACLSLTTAYAEDGDDTLEYYLSKSSLVSYCQILCTRKFIRRRLDRFGFRL